MEEHQYFEQFRGDDPALTMRFWLLSATQKERVLMAIEAARNRMRFEFQPLNFDMNDSILFIPFAMCARKHTSS